MKYFNHLSVKNSSRPLRCIWMEAGVSESENVNQNYTTVAMWTNSMYLLILLIWSFKADMIITVFINICSNDCMFDFGRA